MFLENQHYDRDRASQYLDSTVTKFLESEEDGIAVTKYLGSTTPLVEKTSQNAVSQYLNGPNDISVTKFLDSSPSSAQEDGIAVTKYLG